ncbi:MAG: hypothetical protein JO291_07285 [Acidimicrobiia bacterium]|nr:hypothetical protein [Acidimicrobiia bacterium]
MGFSADRAKAVAGDWWKSLGSIFGLIFGVASALSLALWWKAQGRSWQTGVIVGLVLALAVSLRALFVLRGQLMASQSQLADTDKRAQRAARHDALRREAEVFERQMVELLQNQTLSDPDADAMRGMMALSGVRPVITWVTENFGVDEAALVGDDAPLPASLMGLTAEERVRVVTTALQQIRSLLDELPAWSP